MATIDINSIQSAKRLQADNAKVQKKLSDIESAISQSAKTITKYLDGKVTKTELVNQLDSVRTPDVEKVTELLEQIKQSISEQQPTDLAPITDGIQAVISTTKQLADKIPTNEAKDYTDGLNALLSTAQDIEQTLKDKELSVNVAAPNVAVDAPDLKPLHADNQKIIKAITDIAMPKFSTAELQDGQKELLDVLKKILAKPVGGGGGGIQTILTRNDNAIAVVNPDGSNVGGGSGIVTPTDPLIAYVVQDEAPNDTGASYYGFAKVDGTYLIMERDKTSTPYTDRYANIGNNATRTTYQLAWTNRATLTYSYIFNLSNV